MKETKKMNTYAISKTTNLRHEDAIKKVTETLQSEGFGVLTEIDVSATLKKKLNVDFKKYRILGACNPPYALKALTAEEQIGLMLPCNVIVYENNNSETVVAAVDPLASMMAVKNEALEELGAEIKEKLKRVIDSL